ncbi:hypothetical protein Pla110_24680 [Polystyrenella longa]|uniref:Ribbon-helix-helix domain-containing protein n=1 Tax=Polystyrenella longa TaxID=2528007 RepID=A0A518CNC7_9PLAN|nr:hypothetical protein [Polystyrenella longa]QDU80735.1 hypothetical protein Pla110_24680 [Polystyrenella longa]
MPQNTLNQYRDDNTREIDLADGSKRSVRMTPLLWEKLEFLQIVEGVTTAELATYALEEMTLQDVTFDRAFRGVVAHLANRWT